MVFRWIKLGGSTQTPAGWAKGLTTQVSDKKLPKRKVGVLSQKYQFCGMSRKRGLSPYLPILQLIESRVGQTQKLVKTTTSLG